MVDYDGTLAPLVVARDEALTPQRSLAALRRIGACPHTTVAVVSGRPVGELVRMVGYLPAIMVGEHGYDERAPDGTIVHYPLDPDIADIKPGPQPLADWQIEEE